MAVEQKIIEANKDYTELTEYFHDNRIKSIFIVCGSSIKYLKLAKYFNDLSKEIQLTYFMDFQPNPDYSSVVKGVDAFLESKSDIILTVGGGSAMDVAKCIKLFAYMDKNENFLSQKIEGNDIPLIAIPTTAGTGSESTRYAVIYFNGEKQSVTSDNCIPSVIVLDSSVLKTLPIYQKKATMMDAFSHAIEAFWSVHSTDESKEYSKTAINMILQGKSGYLENTDAGNAIMLSASNYAGKAINITQTTAGHALCYKITSLFGTSHGHAAALCMVKLWQFMYENIEKCTDKRGQTYLTNTFEEIAHAMGEKSVNNAINKVESIISELGLTAPKLKDGDLNILINSVNTDRLKNNPVGLDKADIGKIYRQIFSL